jgi:hypothetical protein
MNFYKYRTNSSCLVTQTQNRSYEIFKTKLIFWIFQANRKYESKKIVYFLSVVYKGLSFKISCTVTAYNNVIFF